MATWEEGSFTNSRGQKLVTVVVKPAAVKAVLLFHVGFGEHFKRYERVFRQLAEDAGVAVCSFDPHGQGRSEPAQDEKRRGQVLDFEHLVDDNLQFLDEVVTPPFPGLPIFVGGHSMGALVGVKTALARSGAFAGLVMHSALIDMEWTPILRFQSKIGACLAALAPNAQMVPAVQPEDMGGPEHVAAYKGDPLIYHANARNKAACEILQGMASIRSRYPQIKLPIYGCHGTQDKCCSYAAAKRLVDAAGSESKTWRPVEGGKHEVILEHWEESVRHVVAWLRERMAAGVAAEAAGGDGGKCVAPPAAAAAAADVQVATH